MYHIFFIHSSVDGHLVGFFVLAVCCKLCFCEHWGACIFKLLFLLFPDIYPGVELLDHIVILFLVFWGTIILFSIVTASIYIPTNSVWGFPFLRILFSICYLQTLMMVFLTILRWSLIVVLICVALIINDIEHLFMGLLVICMSSLGKCWSLLPIF